MPIPDEPVYRDGANSPGAGVPSMGTYLLTPAGATLLLPLLSRGSLALAPGRLSPATPPPIGAGRDMLLGLTTSIAPALDWTVVLAEGSNVTDAALANLLD